jgi:hypothetical protein
MTVITSLTAAIATSMAAVAPLTPNLTTAVISGNICYAEFSFAKQSDLLFDGYVISA